MAKANWVYLSKESGSGNGRVDVGAKSTNTGRNARASIITWYGTGVPDKNRTVIQQGSRPYIDEFPENVGADYQGAVLEVVGISNEAKLKFELGGGDLDISLPETMIAGGIVVDMWDSVNNPTPPTSTDFLVIPGDPGATLAYSFRLKISIPANSGEKVLSRQLIVRGESDNTYAVCTVVSNNDNPYIIVPEGDIIIGADGRPVTVLIESNTSWQIK